MNKAMRSLSGSPRVQVHVSNAEGLYLHVKRTTPSETSQRTMSKDRSPLRPSANVKTRLPWIPPGKTSYKWEGPTHCLEIKPPEPEPELELRLSDLASEEEQHLRSRISQYEKKIESLMSEVSSLRTEVEHRRKEQVLGRKSEQQDDPQQVTAKPEEELAEESKELQEWRNTQLRESIGRKLQETRQSSPDGFPKDPELLLQKLREAEADAAAAAKQVSALKEYVCKLGDSVKNKIMWSGLDQQKELLLGKLEAFEVTNRALRHLLREQRESQMESVGLSEQRKVLLKSLADMEAWNAVLVKKLQEKEKELHQLSTQLDSEKEKARRSADLSQNLDATRARLQGQLRRKEAKNNRLIVQIKSLERAASQHLAEAEQVAQQLGRAKQEAEEEQEALKRASQVQKQRAERCEGTADQLSAQLLQREKQAAEALASADAWQRRHGEEAEKKGQLEVELNLLTSRISDLTDQLQAIQDSGRLENQALLDRLQALTAQKAAAQLETKRLKAAVSAADEKLSRTEAELQQVRTSIKQCEVLLDNYKIQVGNTRAEAEQARAQVAQAERDAQAVRVELEREKEQIRRELQGRLSELEVLPEALRRCQLQLQEAQEEERSRERRNLELSGNLTELRLKVDTQGRQTDLLRQKNQLLMEENQQLQLKVESLERKLSDVSSQNSDLLTVVSKREKTIRTNQLSLEEKTRECSLLSRRLEEAVNDAHQQISETRERAANKERSTQTTIMDLEAQLSRTAAELEQLGHNIEEAERRYQSRLQDLQDRLEQSDSTNRSLQNYVQFLKASYANVFSDGFLSGPRRSPSPV
ncbi:outer dense fiber protein 2 isoform X1 [Xiphophorus maculatus]|uniref:outer dense fiber protein 2 isoform X1 n=2 Tax=Xiphophorus maculatus TaxID=8083 RepID=UPI000C6D55F0|nr:outer dense fiber protein 2 isoform X1 [Xiphophorus maculatus]